jgi:hypothetical protein
MMVTLNEVAAANRLLVSLGAEDQMSNIAAKSIERALELQSRIDRALAYAAQAPSNSMHARSMARILDGSITVDDELNEVPGNDRLSEQLPIPDSSRAALPAVRKTTAGKPDKRVGRGPGLQGRTRVQRKAFREWLASRGVELPKQGPVPQDLVDAYDEAMMKERDARRRAVLAG